MSNNNNYSEDFIVSLDFFNKLYFDTGYKQIPEDFFGILWGKKIIFDEHESWTKQFILGGGIEKIFRLFIIDTYFL